MKVPGWLFLVGAVGLFALKVSIFKLLNNSNPTVFNTCNIVCASQTVGLITSTFFLRHDLSMDKMKEIPRNIWFWMLLGAILSSVLGTYLSNLGWELASVATVSVLQKAQSVFIIIAEPCLSCFAKRPSRWDTFNATATTVGIVLTLVSAPLFFGGKPGISLGQIYILASSLCYTFSLLISKTYLTKVPPGILTVFRLLLGTVSFHVIKLSQKQDNYDALWTSELWLHMLYYGLFFVTVPQQCWLQAVNRVSKSMLSTGVNSQFVVQLVFAMIILSSYPEGAVLVGGSFIFISVVSSIIQANYNTKRDDDEGSEDYQMLEGSLLGEEEEREEEDIVNTGKVEDDDGTMA